MLTTHMVIETLMMQNIGRIHQGTEIGKTVCNDFETTTAIYQEVALVLRAIQNRHCSFALSNHVKT